MAQINNCMKSSTAALAFFIGSAAWVSAEFDQEIITALTDSRDISGCQAADLTGSEISYVSDGESSPVILKVTARNS